MNKLNARVRLFALIIIDSLIVAFSVFICYNILEPFFKGYANKILILTSILLLIAHHVFAYIFNLYHRAWEYASVNELLIIVESVTCSILATVILVPVFTGHPPFFRLYLITWMMVLILIGGSRISWRVTRKFVVGKHQKKKPTLIVGAGRGGSLLIRQMLRSPEMGLEPVLAVDDDPQKRKLTIADGVKVQGTIDDIPNLVNKFRIKRIIIAIPTLKPNRLKEINDICNSTGIELFKMPSIEQVLVGELEVNQLKRVEVEDLLGREPVELNMAMISKELTHKTIMVTGAGGSIGSEICRQVCKFEPDCILLLGHGENSIYLIHQELNAIYKDKIRIIPIIADVQNPERIQDVMNRYKPYAVYHAAAHKHVPLME